MTTQLTPNAITTISQQETSQANADTFQPVVQITSLKLVGKDRYRAVLSDGTHFVQGMLATQLNSLAMDGTLADFTVLRLDKFIKNQVQNKLLIIILDAQILSKPGHQIGTPTDIEKVRNNTANGAMASNKPAAAPMQQQQQQPLYNSTNNNPYGGGGSNAAAAGGGGAGMQQGGAASSNNASPSSRHNPYGASQNNNSYQRQSQQPIMRQDNVTGVGVTPIAGLNMYTSRWTIKARVTEKSDIRTWSNAKGDGCLFSIELLDNSGTDIRGTFFKEAVDKFYNLLEVGKVYRISGGRLKVANMQYNNCKSNFEITFDQNTEIHLDNDEGGITRQQYEFVKIDAIENVPANKSVDILAVVKTVGDVAHITSKKSGQEMAKCDLTLVDDSLAEITLTLWRQKAETAPTDFANQPVVAFKRARVSDYGGKSLSAGSSYEINPVGHVPEAAQLAQWWQTAGGDTAPTKSLSASYSGGGGVRPTLSDRKPVSAIKDDNMGLHSEKGDYLSFKADLCFIKKDKEGGAWYPACPNKDEPCKNRYKVTQTTDQQWQCDRCNGTYPNCVRRWIFSGVVEDGTSSCWVSFFNEQAEVLLGGVTADEAYQRAYEQNDGGYDQDAYDSNFTKAHFAEYVFKCKVKNEMVNEESRIKTSVANMWPVDYVQESKELLEAIAKY